MPTPGPPTLAICNQKGGVGKSTTTFQLARAAARVGTPTLLIDADPQGNLTAAAAAEPVHPDQPGLADALSARAPETLADVAIPTLWPGVDLAPSSGQTLAAVRDELVIGGPGREARLAIQLAAVAGRYRLILIDCPPSLDQLTINALVAADGVAVVTEAKLWASDGLAALLDTVEAVRAHYNPDLRVAGVLVNRFEPRTLSGQHWLSELAAATNARGLRLLHPPIPRRAVIADASEASLGLDQWGGADAAALHDLYASHLRTLLEQP